MMTPFRRALIPDTWGERAFLVLVAVPLLFLIWQAFDRAQPSTVTERQVLTPEVAAGGVLRIQIKQVQHFEASVSVYRSLFDGSNYRFDYGVQVIPPEQLEPEFISQVPILRAASPGNAKVTTTVCWKRPFNVIQQIWPVCQTMKPIEFKITDADQQRAYSHLAP